jgi:mono/diheme cytochrome c family protein
VFAAAGVEIDALRNFLRRHELALISVRDTTRRDGFDTAQPFNLRVRAADGSTGASSIKPGSNAQPFMVDHLQIFQADQLRGVDNHAGRRVLAQPMSPLLVDGKPVNLPADANVAKGSVRVQAVDGSVAAIVPARRALTWQLIDSQNPGDPKRGTDGIVRERFHVSFQPGEVRVCANCHGVSDKDQVGARHDTITNPPQALRQLLEHLKLHFDLNTPTANAQQVVR